VFVDDMALVVFSQFARIRCWVPVSSAVLLTQKTPQIMSHLNVRVLSKISQKLDVYLLPHKYLSSSRTGRWLGT